MLPGNQPGDPDLAGLEILGIDAVVAHQGVGQSYQLPGIGRVGKHFLIAGHAGVEHHFPVAGQGRAKGFAPVYRAVLQHQISRPASGRCQNV